MRGYEEEKEGEKQGMLLCCGEKSRWGGPGSPGVRNTKNKKKNGNRFDLDHKKAEHCRQFIDRKTIN